MIKIQNTAPQADTSSSSHSQRVTSLARNGRKVVAPSLLSICLYAVCLSLPFPSEADERFSHDARFAEKPGRLVAWGEFGDGEKPQAVVETLPSGRETEGFVQLSGLHSSWAALHSDGSVIVRRCPTPDLSDVNGKLVKISVSHGFIVGLDDRGNGYVWSGSNTDDLDPPEPLTNLVDIEAGKGQIYALTRDGRLIWWGKDQHLPEEFSERVAPFQEQILRMSAGGYGGALIGKNGTLARWDNFKTLNFITEPEQALPVDSRVISIQSSVLFSRPLGAWEKAGGSAWPSSLTAERVQATDTSLLLADAGDRHWSVYGDDKFASLEGITAFLDENRPAAVQTLGFHPGYHPAEKRTLGLIAILPPEPLVPPITAAPTPSAPKPTPMPASTTLPAEAPVRADHGITDARFLAQLKLYEAELQQKVRSAYDTSLSDLNTKLDGALAREEKEAIGSGNLDGVTAFRAEREKLAADELPETDPDTMPETIKRFRNAWRAKRAKIDAQRALDAGPVRESFEKKLIGLEKTLTQEQRIDEALKVRAFRRKLTPVDAP